MADIPERTAASELDDGTPILRDVPERSDTSLAPALQESSVSTAMATRPRQIVGHYPPRRVTYYQFSTSDVRSIGIAQAVVTVFAALGTFALSIYLDFGKDITLATGEGESAPQFLYDIESIAFYSWLVFWGLAICAFIYQRTELRRIKAEHGEPSLLSKIWKGVFGNG